MDRRTEALAHRYRGAPGEDEQGPARDGELFRFLINFDPGRGAANQVAGKHWGEDYRLRAAGQGHALAYWRMAGSPKAPGPVRVVWVVFRGQPMDLSNLGRGLKGPEDALFGRQRYEVMLGGRRRFITEPGNITPDDSPKWVRGVAVEQVNGTRWAGNEWVLCVVIDAREESDGRK